MVKFSYPSIWNTNKTLNTQYEVKKKKLRKWDSVNISKEKKEENFLKALPIKLINSLRIFAENIKIIFFDNHIHTKPFTLEFFVKSFKIDELSKYKLKLNEEEKKNIKKNLLINIWIRLIGIHMIYKEYRKKIKYNKRVKKENEEKGCKRDNSKEKHDKSQNKSETVQGKICYICIYIYIYIKRLVGHYILYNNMCIHYIIYMYI